MVTNGISEDDNQILALTDPITGTGNKHQNDLGDFAQEYGQKVTEKAVQARDFVADKLSVAGEKIKDLQNRDFGEVVDQAKDYAKKNPGQVIVGAVAAGFILGLLVKIGRR
jgi:ElaB/YqjD/DUF883 family membrane-anchored ribosome-binding protein